MGNQPVDPPSFRGQAAEKAAPAGTVNSAAMASVVGALAMVNAATEMPQASTGNSSGGSGFAGAPADISGGLPGGKIILAENGLDLAEMRIVVLGAERSLSRLAASNVADEQVQGIRRLVQPTVASQ
jgi:hypothetical protein